jgi:hypothetical protein
VRTLHRLAGDRGNEVEILVDVQNDHDRPGEFGNRRDEQTRDRRCPVVALIAQQPLDLGSAIFHGRCQVLDRHRRQRWTAHRRTQFGPRPGREADLQPGHRGDRTRPRCIRTGHSPASRLAPIRTSADLSTIQPLTPTPEPSGQDHRVR